MTVKHVTERRIRCESRDRASLGSRQIKGTVFPNHVESETTLLASQLNPYVGALAASQAAGVAVMLS